MTVDLFLLWATFLPAASFTLVYGLTSRWWVYQEGQNVLALSAIVSLLAGRGLVLRYMADAPADSTWTLRVLVGLLAAVLWWRLVLLVKAKHEAITRRGGE